MFKLSHVELLRATDGDEQRDLAVVSRPLSGGAILQVARSTDNRAVLLAPLRRTMWLAGTAAVLLSAGGGAWLAWRAIKPVRAVAATAHRIVATGIFRPAWKASGATTRWATSCGSSTRCWKETAVCSARCARRSTTWRTTCARRSPGCGPAPRWRCGRPTIRPPREALADCIEETDRIQRLLETLLDISAAENGVLKLEREQIDVGALLQSVAELYAIVAEEKPANTN